MTESSKFKMYDKQKTVHGKRRLQNQVDATCYYIVLLIGSTCFGHYYAHHQELATMMLITTLHVVSEVQLGWSGVRVAGLSLTPNIQQTKNDRPMW